MISAGCSVLKLYKLVYVSWHHFWVFVQNCIIGVQLKKFRKAVFPSQDLVLVSSSNKSNAKRTFAHSR